MLVWLLILSAAAVMLLSQGLAGATVTSPRSRATAPVPGARRHLILIPDGLPYRVVAECHAAGGLAGFHPPQRMICPFPSMTDLAMSDILGGERPNAFEAQYFDRATGRLVGGAAAYMWGHNSMWMSRVDYRCRRIWAGIGYVRPRWVFRKELRDLEARFRRSASPRFVAYLHATAGVGTAEGEDGLRHVLDRTDAFCRRLMKEHVDALDITMLSDHGHTLCAARQADLAETLADSGFHVAHVLTGPRDVVIARFGLVTYAAMWTQSAQNVAEALVENRATNLVMYPEEGAIAVRSADGVARIHEHEGRYRYETLTGDPLELAAVIAELRRANHVDGRGFVDDRALFLATAEHTYPDAPARIWRAFHGVVAQSPDLIVTLRDDYWEGSRRLARWTAVRSTHGSLNRENSTAFVMSTVGCLPAPIRTADFREAFSAPLDDPTHLPGRA